MSAIIDAHQHFWRPARGDYGWLTPDLVPLYRASEPWARDIAAIAADGRSVCKLSGLATETGPEWTADGLRPWVDHLLSCFGPDRLMFGSDWPVLTLAGSYDDWVSAVRGYLSGLTDAERAAVLGGNAVRVYRLDR